MTQSQIINVKTSTNRAFVLMPSIEYQMIIDAFGHIAFIDLSTGNYLPDTLKEVEKT